MGPPRKSSWSSLALALVSANQRPHTIIPLELELNPAKGRPLGNVQHRLESINAGILEMAHDKRRESAKYLRLWSQ